jgi:hypothetical protein
MAYVKKDAHGMLDSIKDDIQRSYQYFYQNYQRFHEFMGYIYKTTLTNTDKSVLMELQKPQIEFNLLEAYISRLCGEFSKMDPAFSVRAADGVALMDPSIIQLVEAHMKAAFTGSDKDALSYQLYREMLSGGYSVAKVYTDYANEKSFDQNIYIERVFDPTLTGFDPLARDSHKGDGRYAYELFPKSKGEAEELYGSDIVKGTAFTRNSSVENFNWSYKNQTEDILLFAEYYRKKMKKAKILKLANGHVVPEKVYEDFLAKWEEAGILEQPPIVLKSRWTEIELIEKYTLCESKIIDHEVTNFSHLPLVFFDGNSVTMRDSDQSQAHQMTRSYIYQAIGGQKMKNFAGQSLCNEIENLMQSQWIAPIEAIPDNDDYQYAYTNPQKATVVLYNQWKDGNPEMPVTPPTTINRPPIPPEISNAFAMADQVIQGTLGSYDAAMGINDNDISGTAIMQGAMHSNAAAMPYTVGFIRGWNRCGEIYLDMLPKYYVTPRTIPIIKPDGKRDYYEINKPGNLQFDYDASALEVQVEAGVNFAVQKQVALKAMIQLMQASPQFAQFMNTEGLEVLLDNLDIRGIDNIKVMAAEWMKNQKQMQEQQAQAQAQQMTPEQMAQQQMQLEQAKIQQKAEEAQLKARTEMQTEEMKAQVDLTKISTDDAVKNKEIDIKFMEVMTKIQNADLDAALQQEKVEAENARSAVDMAINVSKHHNDLMRERE